MATDIIKKNQLVSLIIRNVAAHTNETGTFSSGLGVFQRNRIMHRTQIIYIIIVARNDL